MQARTERRLGIAAALVLTAAAFVMPNLSAYAARDSRVHVAQAEQSQIAPNYR